jgi:hypothetical protein
MHQIHFVTAAIEHQALPASSGSLAIFAAITGPQLRLPIWPCVDPNSA